MMRRLGRWLVETRLGRFAFRAIPVLFILGTAYAVIHVEVGRQTREITKRVEVIERIDPIDVVRKCIRTERCRELLTDPPPSEVRGGDASQPAPVAGQPSELPIGVGQGEGQRPGQKPAPKSRPPKPQTEPPPVSEDIPDSPAAQPNPPRVDTPGKGNGPPAGTPGAEAPGLVGDLTGPVGGAIDDVGKGVDKALCPAADRLADLCAP